METDRKHPEYQYLDLMQNIMETGDDRAMHIPGDQGIRCVVGALHRYDLQKDGFPLLTTKDVYWKGVREEMLWFLSGESNIKPLVDNGVNIWVPDAHRKYQRAAKRGDTPSLTEEEYIDQIKYVPEFFKSYKFDQRYILFK